MLTGEFETVEAPTGANGVEQAKAGGFDLILLEWRQHFARHAAPMMREKVSDLTDVHIRVLSMLLDLPDHDPVDVPRGTHAILVTHDLTRPGLILIGDAAGFTLNTGLTIRGGLTFAPVVLAAGPTRALPIYLGVGARYYQHHYDPASIDELPDRHVGLEGTLGVALARRGPRLELYLDGGPGYDVGRSDSCSFASGVMTVCPHQQATRLYWHGGLGVRWYLGVGG